MLGLSSVVKRFNGTSTVGPHKALESVLTLFTLFTRMHTLSYVAPAFTFDAPEVVVLIADAE